jgi:hypothetical protein
MGLRGHEVLRGQMLHVFAAFSAAGKVIQTTLHHKVHNQKNMPF